MSGIHTKLAKVAGEIGSINKTERNKEQGFNFRSIEQITGAVRPLFAKEGISVAPKMLSLEHHEVTSAKGSRGFRAVVVMQYTFSVGDSPTSVASSVTISMPGEAVDYGDKSTSKAVQMAYKYALTQVLQVGSGDDPDAHSVEIGHYEPRTRQNRPRATENAPPTSEPDKDIEGRKWEATQKLRLMEVFGDKDQAKKHWEGILRSYGYALTATPDQGLWQEIEDDITQMLLDLKVPVS